MKWGGGMREIIQAFIWIGEGIRRSLDNTLSWHWFKLDTLQVQVIWNLTRLYLFILPLHLPSSVLVSITPNKKQVSRVNITLHICCLCRFLKQLHRNREEEAKLMANVPGWEVGTWYGEPVYRTLPPDTLVAPHINEFYVHASDRELKRRVNFKLWT
jgi:hypothetical protein